MIDNQTDFEHFSEFYSFWKRWNFEGNTWRSNIKKGELNCKNYLVRCVGLRFRAVWMKEKSDFCRMKFTILYYISYSKNVFLRLNGRICGLTFYGSGWSLTKAPLWCREKIIFVLDFELCLWGTISKNSSR